MKTKIVSLFTVICIVFVITACTRNTWLYRINVQQGNVISSDTLHQLHPGMTKETVCNLMGPPVLIDTFNNDRWTYTYMFKSGQGRQFTKMNLVIYFMNDKISHIKTGNRLKAIGFSARR
jgi:outer membrane protein assembly factor BamE